MENMTDSLNDPVETVEEYVKQSIKHFKLKVLEAAGSNNIEKLSLEKIKCLRNAVLYESIALYIENCESKCHKLNEIGKLSFLLQDELSSAYLDIVY